MTLALPTSRFISTIEAAFRAVALAHIINGLVESTLAALHEVAYAVHIITEIIIHIVTHLIIS